MNSSGSIAGNKLLLIDANEDFIENTYCFLQEKKLVVYKASTSKEGLEIAKSFIPDLILLDIDFTDTDGIETCQALREIPALKSTIIVFVSMHTEDYVQIACFKAGADDYLTKPIKNIVLLYRIQALLKRHLNIDHRNSPAIIEPDSKIDIDPEKFIVRVGRSTVNLPKKQFLLLQLLMSHPSKVYSRNSILELIWGG